MLYNLYAATNDVIEQSAYGKKGKSTLLQCALLSGVTSKILFFMIRVIRT